LVPNKLFNPSILRKPLELFLKLETPLRIDLVSTLSNPDLPFGLYCLDMSVTEESSDSARSLKDFRLLLLLLFVCLPFVCLTIIKYINILNKIELSL